KPESAAPATPGRLSRITSPGIPAPRRSTCAGDSFQAMFASRSITRSFECENAKLLSPFVEPRNSPGYHQKALTANTNTGLSQTPRWTYQRIGWPSPRRQIAATYATKAEGAISIAVVRWTRKARLATEVASSQAPVVRRSRYVTNA